MPVRNPMEMHIIFEKSFNAGDLDGLLALYEKDAVLSPEPGRIVAGHGAIREAFAGFLASRPAMSLKTASAFETDGLALLHGKWELKGTGPDGVPFEAKGLSSEVLRRQADGGWLYIIDNPFSPQ